MTSLFIDPAHRDDIFGIALSSPGLCSPGLCGRQGWSPCTSDCSSFRSDDEDDEDEALGEYMPKKQAAKRLQRSMSSILKHKRHTVMAWPMPPARLPVTRPLSLRKRSLSLARAPAMTMSSSECSTSDESSAVTVSDLEASLMAESRKGSRKAMSRRVFSVPMPMLSYADEDAFALEDGPQLQDKRFDEALPLMPLTSAGFQHDWDDEEEVKMARLHASMSLLGVQSGPRVGTYTPSFTSSSPSSSGSPISSESSSPRSRSESRTSAEDGHTPTAGLCLLRMALSPEHKAPTLQEQMAFASGLGNMCAWASPLNQAYVASADDYLREFGHPVSNDALSPCSIRMGDVTVKKPIHTMTDEQSERRHASRHIRQQVAASAAAAHFERAVDSLERAASMQEEQSHLYADEENGYEQGSPFYESMLHEEVASKHRSFAASIVSAAASPILDGSSSSGFSQTDSVVSTNESSAVEDLAAPNMPNDSPMLAQDEEYSYLAHNDAYLYSVIQGSPQQEVFRQQDQSKHWPDANGFDGNTFSPCIATPDLDLSRSPSPMQMAPSPCMTMDSICPQIAKADDTEEFLPIQTMTNSTSVSSVLHRPRPIASSQSASFFRQADMVCDARRVTVRKRSERTMSAADVLATTNDQASRNPGYVVPPRKTSLDMSNRLPRSESGKMQQCISFKDEPHPRHLLSSVAPVASPSASLPHSYSTGCLTPKGLAQVREACRLKTFYLRGGQTLIDCDSDLVKDDAPPPLPPMPKSVSLSNKAHGTQSRPETVATSSRSWIEQVPMQKQTQVNEQHQKGMPTLFVARTPSQRKRGSTGIAATEPFNLALAKLGMASDIPTRTSTVHALAKLPPLASRTADDGASRASSSSSRSCEEIDPALAVAAELQSGLDGMPDGFILIVEETQSVSSHVLCPAKQAA